MSLAQTTRRLAIFATLYFICGAMGAMARSVRVVEGPSAPLRSSLSIADRGISSRVIPFDSTLPFKSNSSGPTSPGQSSLRTSAVSPASSAANDPDSMSIRFSDPDAQRGGQPAPMSGGLQIKGLTGTNVPWSIVIMLTLLTLIPAILMCVTPFARLLIVFHFLRQALGLQTTPSNPTLIGLSLILTFFIMQPVAMEIYQDAIVPAQSGQLSLTDAVKVGEVPLRKFMAHYVREKDVALFVEMAKEPRPASVNDLSMRVLLPAYILSELKAGFQIGTVLFLPFLIVDMVVASITTSVGMLQLPPVVISTPLKLLLFLMVDGWHLLIGSLIRSFN
jgi:flagellar biosynthesis protein FliP